MERASFLSPSQPAARKSVKARLAARKENAPPSPETLKARHDAAAANRDRVLSARKEKAAASATPRKELPTDTAAERKQVAISDKLTKRACAIIRRAAATGAG